MSEVVELAGDTEKEMQIKAFIKKFVDVDVEKAKNMRKELNELDLIKLKDEHIVKIIDFMPKDAEDLNKVAADVSFDQEETTKILDVVKKF